MKLSELLLTLPVPDLMGIRAVPREPPTVSSPKAVGELGLDSSYTAADLARLPPGSWLPNPRWDPIVFPSLAMGETVLRDCDNWCAFPRPTPESLRGGRAERADRILAMQDPVERNYETTSALNQFARDMRELLRLPDDVVFPAFMSWGSERAGYAIRRENIFRRQMNGRAGSRARTPSATVRFPGVQRAAERFTALVGRGNYTIFFGVGQQYGRFVDAFESPGAVGDLGRLEAFLASLPQGDNTHLMREGFRAYFAAVHEPDASRKSELILMGNCLHALREQREVQPYISQFLPPILSSLMTRLVLGLDLGSEFLAFGNDVPGVGAGTYPTALRALKLEPVRQTVTRLESEPDSVHHSRAHDWRSLTDRMHWIVELLRTRQGQTALYEPPPSVRAKDAQPGIVG